VEALDVLLYDGTRMTVGAASDAEVVRIVAEGGRRGEIYAALRALRDRHAEAIRTRFPDIPRRVSGYNLPALMPDQGFQVARALVGSEGTCVTILEASVRLVQSPPQRVLLLIGYPDIFEAADDVPALLESKPIGLEGVDGGLARDMRRKGLHVDELRLLPRGNGWLFAEFGGATPEEARA